MKQTCVENVETKINTGKRTGSKAFYSLLHLGFGVDVAQNGDVREVDPEFAEQRGHPAWRRHSFGLQTTNHFLLSLPGREERGAASSRPGNWLETSRGRLPHLTKKQTPTCVY